MKVTTKNLSETKVEVTVTLNQNDLKVAEDQAILRLSKESTFRVSVQVRYLLKLQRKILIQTILPVLLPILLLDVLYQKPLMKQRISH